LSSAPCKKRSSAPCSRTQPLTSWYAAHARALPWRDTTDAYRIWISEIMLQQTQVATVLPRYLAWFDTFPDIAALAAAHLDDVLKAWEGLGYYRRARFIHAAAQRIRDVHGGTFPHEFSDIQTLPGIGNSTAGAISSFCFATPTPVLDGNVKRVLKRWYAVPEATDKSLWPLAQEAINVSDDPATWNQAMMELGAMLCLPVNPGCAECPVQEHCASAFGSFERTSAKTVAIRDLHWLVHLHIDAKHGIWLTQRPATGIWAGLWTPPITELAQAPQVSPSHVHLLTHRRLHLYAELCGNPPCGNGQWVTDPRRVALPTGIHRLLNKHDIP